MGKKGKGSGFTIVETVIAVAISLSAMSVAGYMMYYSKKHDDLFKKQVFKIQLAQDLMRVIANGSYCKANFSGLSINNNKVNVDQVFIGTDVNSSMSVIKSNQVANVLGGGYQKIGQIQIKIIENVNSNGLHIGKLIVPFVNNSEDIKFSDLAIPITLYLDSLNKIQACKNQPVDCTQNGQTNCFSNINYIAGKNLAKNKSPTVSRIEFDGIPMSMDGYLMLAPIQGFHDGTTVYTRAVDSNYIADNFRQGFKILNIDGTAMSCQDSGLSNCIAENSFVAGYKFTSDQNATSYRKVSNTVYLGVIDGFYDGVRQLNYSSTPQVPTPTSTPSTSTTPPLTICGGSTGSTDKNIGGSRLSPAMHTESSLGNCKTYCGTLGAKSYAFGSSNLCMCGSESSTNCPIAVCTGFFSVGNCQ